MGSEVDVLKLRSSLLLFLKLTPDDDQGIRTLAGGIIGVS
jgi:hypothetical protein